MIRLALAGIIVLSSFAAVLAQDEKKLEVFGGYSFESIDSGINSTDVGTPRSLENRFKANGFQVSATGYLTRRFGITGDFSGHFDNRTDFFSSTAGRSKFSLYNITGGPQFRFRSTGRLTPFAQALAGVARRNFTETIDSIPTSFSDNKTNFALNLGGGIDYKLSDRFAWRLIQFDYNPIFVRSRTVDSFLLPNRTLNGFRFSTGIVIK